MGSKLMLVQLRSLSWPRIKAWQRTLAWTPDCVCLYHTVKRLKVAIYTQHRFWALADPNSSTF